ncbi:MAG: DUF3106 domain-containing protein [Lysobacter sp.]
MSRAEPSSPRSHSTRAGWRGASWAAVALLLLATLAHATPAVLQDFAAVLPRLQPPQRAELLRHADRWSAWDEAERRAFRARAAQWEALAPAERGRRRERFRAWQALPAAEQARVRAAARTFAQLPAGRQQALRAQFDALDRSERRGWLLGPDLGADYPALQPLLAQLPAAEHAGVLAALRAMAPRQRRDLAVLVQRTPPQERAELRRELLSTAAANRSDWLWERLHR